jgi:hypothetical protein
MAAGKNLIYVFLKLNFLINVGIAMGIKSGEPLNSLGEQLGEAITFF